MTTQTHRFENGFRVVTEHMPSLNSATAGVWVNAGSRNETIEQNGIAHFLEHMAFKGTDRRSAVEIAKEIEDVGGHINAYTSNDTTAYYARVLKDNVHLALDILADILLNPTFAQSELDVERNVILQEIGMINDTPNHVILDWLHEQAYQEQPLGRPIIGLPERVSVFDRSDLLRFMDKQYTPDQMVLSVAGAVDHDAVVRQAEELFGHLAPRSADTASLARFVGGEERRIKPLEQAHFALAFESPSLRDDAVYAAEIYATALGGGTSSRLFQSIREDRGLCYTIFAYEDSWIDTGMISVYAGTSAEQINELATIVIDEIKRTADNMSSDEINRARTQLKANQLMKAETSFARASRSANLLHIWDRVPLIDETMARFDAVTTKDVLAIAENIASSAPMALALYGPIDDAPSRKTLQERLAA